MGTKDTLSARLIRLRERAKLSQERLATLAGVSSSTVKNIEQGVSKRPSYDTLDRLAAVLGVEVSALVPPRSPARRS